MTLSVTIEIAAPIDRVWQILTDFGRYDYWNRFTPRVHCLPVEGSPVTLLARLDHGEPRTVRLTLRRFEPPRALCWGSRHWWLSAERCQTLEPCGEDATLYRSTETFRGLLAPALRLTQRDRLLRGYRWAAEGLRDAAEAKH